MATKKKAAKKKAAKKRATANRELIDTGTNKLFARRNALGTSFTEVVDVSRSLAAARRTKAKKVAKSGQGDRATERKSAREPAQPGAVGDSDAWLSISLTVDDGRSSLKPALPRGGLLPLGFSPAFS